jgi:hypothetical protein
MSELNVFKTRFRSGNYDRWQCGVQHNTMAGTKAQCAILIARTIAHNPGRMLDAAYIADHAIDITERLFAAFERKGWSATLPDRDSIEDLPEYPIVADEEGKSE